MRIDEVQLKGFGKWHDAIFRFAPGINVFEAPNESGKSTLLQGIIAALYGMKKDYVKSARYLAEYEKYRPWHQGDYETIITYQLGGKTYRLHRYLNKEREQARIFLDPEWTELTDIYLEDRRKERNFIEKHLGLTRSLFTDITWIRQEPLSAAEHLLPSLIATDDANPAVNKILAELDRDLANIGKKERAENTLLGKAATLAAQKEQELANREAAWKVISQLTKKMAQWEDERAELAQLRERLLKRLELMQQRSEMWQERWQKSYLPPGQTSWEWWEQTAGSTEEQRIHQEAKAALEKLKQTQSEDSQETSSVGNGTADHLRLQQDYEQGIQLQRRREQCHLELASLAAVAMASPRRQGRLSKEENLKKQRRGKILLWGTGSAFMLLGILAFFTEHSIFGGIALGLSVLFSGTAFWIYRGKESKQVEGMASGSVSKEEWQRLQEEVARLDESLLQLVSRWGAANWDEFLEKREGLQNSIHTRESRQMAAQLNQLEEEALLINSWGESLRSCLGKEKAGRENDEGLLQAELSQADSRLQELREQIAGANGQIAAHETGSAAEAKAEQEEAANGLRQLQLRRDALQIARDALQEAMAEWNRDVSPAVNHHASEVISQITGGTYQDVRLDPREGFAIRLLEPSRHLVLEQDQCSTGTQDQLYFAQRLALLRHVCKETETLPIFLDDHFVHYDQERLRRTLEYVARLGESQQIFLFTCHDRELQLLKPFMEQAGGRHRVHQLREMC